MYSKALVAILGLVASASAHMKCQEPKPMSPGRLNNSPLNADGSDFPCKNSGSFDAYQVVNVNQYSLGQKYPLTFIGQAVHGGGSCQVSLTKDARPTKNSVWKVIKSIEGGCPARGEAGNMGDNAEAEDPYKYDFTIPADIEPGNYTIAWSWFNKIGNREMYMNCGAANIAGSGGSAGAFDSLPDMFKANIGEDGDNCGTVSSTDLEFPNPGADVERLNGATTAFAAPTGCTNAPAKAPKPAPEADEPKTTKAAEAGPAKTGLPGAVFVTVQTSEPAASAPTNTPESPEPEEPEEPEEPAPQAPAPAPVPAPKPAAGSGSSGSFAPGTACTTEGFWNCIGGSSFQRCASGQWSAVQALAAGTSCSGSGPQENINISKRDAGSRSRWGAKFFL